MVKSKEIEYWNMYYSQGLYATNRSNFAEFALKYMETGKTVADMGCGSGRDSIFLAQSGLIVTAIDSSPLAIKELKRLSQINGISIKAVEGDFVNFLENRTFDYIYSRFTLHSISEKEERTLIRNAFCSLGNAGYFFIEARSVRDDIYGFGECVGHNEYIYGGHYRRFIVLDEIAANLGDCGFNIVYCAEDRGFAVYKDEDPICVRIVAAKRTDE